MVRTRTIRTHEDEYYGVRMVRTFMWLHGFAWRVRFVHACTIRTASSDSYISAEVH